MDKIIEHQQIWATANNKEFDQSGNLKSYEFNLFWQLDDYDLKCLKKGSGNELKDKNGEKAKMKSLKSSSALCVNFFLYLKQNGLLPLFLKQIGIHCNNVVSAEFEKQLKTNASSAKANLDFYIEYDYCIVGIESKFTEHYSIHNLPLKQSYLCKENEWTLKEKFSKNFPNLAKWINSEWKPRDYYGKDKKKKYTGRYSPFEYLDAEQLVKHLFALNIENDNYTLVYIHYDIHCDEMDKHQKEIEVFKDILNADNVHFISISYQEIFKRMKEDLKSHSEYIEKMTSRYFNKI